MSDGEIASAFSWPKVWLINNAAGIWGFIFPSRDLPAGHTELPLPLPLPELPLPPLVRRWLVK